MLRTIRSTLLLVILVGLLLVNPTRLFACFCVPEKSPTDELTRSTAVFAGRVTQIETSSTPMWEDVESVNVTLQVSRVWKGPLRTTLTVLTARQGIDCGYEFEEDVEYLVYARGSGDNLTVWFCSRTRPLASAQEDLAALGAGNTPTTGQSNRLGIEVYPSANIAGKRETSQSFVYFVLWDWLMEGDQFSEQHVDLAFWNMPDKAPIVSSLLWHGTVYGGLVKKDTKLVLIEKIGNTARMTGPWEFGGNKPYRIGVDDQPLVAEMIASHVAVYGGDPVIAGNATKYTIRAGDTLGEIALRFNTSVGAIAQANNIVDPDLVFTGQVLVIPP
ncbi:MAG: LysM peptidoglycan-binding domain-containing protein [Anaerolineae bacterium]